ncbi:MAG: DNA polymerase IV [Myxococcota bacterium]
MLSITVVRVILHVDMDAFFASVEQRDDPALHGRPVLVGGPVRRGVVAAASYEARTFGVHSAMPMAEALRRCPQAVVVSGRHGRYADVSARVFAIFARMTPLVEGLSLDEAFLDVTESRALFGDGEAVARRIKEAIVGELGLTASAGVAACKFVAKIASDLEKPDGLVVVPPGREAALLAPLPIERMWGVGPKTAPGLRAAGLSTIGDLARAPVARLEALLGSWGAQVRELARGVDDRPVVPGRAAVSIGAEETFDEDLTARSDLLHRILGQASRVARRARDEGACGRVVVLKIKYADFKLVTRRATLDEPVDDTDSIYQAASALLDRVPGIAAAGGKRVRLTGVALADLAAGPPPPTLFPDERAARRRKLESAVCSVAAKFGARSVTRATLVDDENGD